MTLCIALVRAWVAEWPDESRPRCLEMDISGQKKKKKKKKQKNKKQKKKKKKRKYIRTV
jgi:hypothetical protein